MAKRDRLLRIATEFRHGLLEGEPSISMCYVVSAPLAGYLRMLGYDCELVRGEVDAPGEFYSGHYWIALADGRIIDATADQFSTPRRPMPEVYIGERPEWYRAATA